MIDYLEKEEREYQAERRRHMIRGTVLYMLAALLALGLALFVGGMVYVMYLMVKALA